VCVDGDIAEDVLQEAFLALWREPSRYDPARGSFASWLLTVVHHKSVDAVRRKSATRHRIVSNVDEHQRSTPPGPEPFLNWASRRQLLNVHPPRQPAPQPREFADDERRWALARDLLHNDTHLVVDRAAGLLVLLYAQRVSRITRLTADDLHRGDGSIYLSLGRDALALPEPLGQLVTQLPDHRPVGMAGHLHAQRWLFPGRQPDRPMHPSTLAVRLNRLGIHARRHRNAALLQLAAELPIPVVADLLGVHISTASNWADHSGSNWRHYAAQRGLAKTPEIVLITDQMQGMGAEVTGVGVSATR